MMSDQKKLPLGIKIFGFAFIVGSLYSIFVNRDYSFYCFLFQKMPQQLILVRYCFTLVLRILGIITGVGLLVRKESFRRIALLIALFTIVTIYWKHPYDVFYNIVVHNQYGVRDVNGVYVLRSPNAPLVTMLFYYVIDLGFSLSVIIYFMKSRVRKYFR